MADATSMSSDSDIDDLDSCMWPLKNQTLKQNITVETNSSDDALDESFNNSLLSKFQKFKKLKETSNIIRQYSAKKLYLFEKRRAKKLVKRALRDPFVKDLVDKNQATLCDKEETNKKKEADEWKEVKPFLDVNNHLQGAVSHGDWGPRTELESKIDDAIKQGDFEKAELLSDTLANKKFATKITKAYAAKRYHDQLEKQKSIEKDEKSRKIKWTFDAKERWQMKGNM